MFTGVNFRAVNEIFSENSRYQQEAQTARNTKKKGDAGEDPM